jgi:hypothetical protein
LGDVTLTRDGKRARELKSRNLQRLANLLCSGWLAAPPVEMSR